MPRKVQAQTISNLYLAISNDLEIIPVLNKIDMESAMIDTVEEQIVDLLGCGKEDILHISARTGQGVPELLQAIIERVPAPEGDPTLRCKPSFLTRCLTHFAVL